MWPLVLPPDVFLLFLRYREEALRQDLRRDLESSRDLRRSLDRGLFRLFGLTIFGGLGLTPFRGHPVVGAVALFLIVACFFLVLAHLGVECYADRKAEKLRRLK